MFDIVNEVAVLSTAFLMVGVSIVWYSNILFGKRWEAASGVFESAHSSIVSLAQLLLCYFVILMVLAYALAVAPLVPIEVAAVAFGVLVLISCTQYASAVAEGKSRGYILINLGFYAVFIIVSTLVLQFWPW